jgi:glutamate-1-semialdehyde 2,1-aminomutase
MASGIAQLSACLEKGFYETLEKKCNTLVDGIRSHVSKNKYSVKLFSIGSIFWIAFSDQEKISSAEDIDASSMAQFRKLFHALLEKGIYIGPSGYEVGFVSAAHSEEDIEKTIVAFNESLDIAFA